jgi:phosphoribosylanthranilate isomerase
VFVNEAIENVNAVADEVGLGAVQLHGDETPDLVARSRRPVIKTIARVDQDSQGRWPEPVMLLVDADDRERRGGTGQRADWHAAARLATERRILLAGGLTAANVADAVRMVRPFGIDVSSGVEDAPGIKNPGRIGQLFDALRNVTADPTVRR